MSANVKTKPRIRWDDEGAWLKLADLPYEASEEVADGFIVDASPDRRVTGLEILWPAAERSGYAKEPALAFGLFCAALAGLSWQYNDYLRSPVEMRNPVAGIYSQLKGMIDAIGVEIQVSLETLIPAHSRANLLDLAILDSNGNLANLRGNQARQVPAGYRTTLYRTAQGHHGIGLPKRHWYRCIH